MAIVKMKKISLIGLSSHKEEIIGDLMDLSAVEISSQDAKLTDKDWSSLVERDGDESTVAAVDAEIFKVSTVLDLLRKYDTGKKPLFRTRREMSKEAFKAALCDCGKIREQIDAVHELSEKLNQNRTEENRINAGILTLNPWVRYDVPLEFTGTKHTGCIIGTVPAVTEIGKLSAQVEESGLRCSIEVLSSDEDQHYLCVIFDRAQEDETLGLFKQFGFGQTVFKEYTGTAAEVIEKSQQELKALGEEKANIENSIREYVEQIKNIELVYDDLILTRERAKIRGNLLKTDNVFYLDGYVPAPAAKKVEETMGKYDCVVSIEDPAPGEECPVFVQNAGAVVPFEAVTNMYSTPAYTGIDPTPFFAIFYAIFFGLMLSDAVYGIIITIACFVILRKYKLEGTTFRMIKMFLFCGISTIIWGALFGGWCGDLPTVAAKVIFGVEDFVIPALWFEPVKDPMTLLIFSFILGGIHLFLGMGIKAYMLIRDGHLVDAVCDIFTWYALLIGLVLFGVSGMIGLPAIAGTIGMWLAIIGAAGILLTGGRDKKNIFGKITGGLGGLYNITSYLSDILSYSRLLALGLATGVIAQVINTMGSLAGGGVLGIIILVIVAIFGHSFNIAINALGSFVHSCRLQYVEFFGKFFEGGGEPFKPFGKETKYVKINN